MSHQCVEYIPVDYDMSGIVSRKQLNDASRRPEFVVILAPNEIETGQVILKSMKDGLRKQIQCKQPERNPQQNG